MSGTGGIIQRALHRQHPDINRCQFLYAFLHPFNRLHRDFWLVRYRLAGPPFCHCRETLWSRNTGRLRNSFAHYGGSGLNMFGYNPNSDEGLTKQGRLPGFFFDAEACRSSHGELMVPATRPRSRLPGRHFVQRLFRSDDESNPCHFGDHAGRAKRVGAPGDYSRPREERFPKTPFGY